MKKITLLLLLFLLILTSCSDDKNINGDSTNSVSNNNNEAEKQEVSIDIWDIEPIYGFDNIEVKFTFDNTNEIFGSAFYRDSDNCYGLYKKGGLLAKKNDVIYIIDDLGKVSSNFSNMEILTIEQEIGAASSPSNLWIIDPKTAGSIDSKGSYFVLTDYSIEYSPWSTYGATGAMPCLSFNKNRNTLYEFYVAGVVDGTVENKKEFLLNLNEKEISISDYKFSLYGSKLKGSALFMSSTINSSKYEEENGFVNGYVLYKDSEYKVLDTIPDGYGIEGFSDGVMLFKKGDYYLVNFDSRYNVFNNFDSKDILYIDLDSNVLASGYSDGYGFYEGYAPVCKDNKWGYIDKDGNVVIDFIFDKATPISDGKAWVIYKGRTGRLNILDMLNNNIPFIDETLNIESYTPLPQIKILADNIKIRKEPSINGEHITKVIKDQIFLYTNKKEADGYTWYEIAKDMWIADKNGEWIEEQQ